MLNQITSRLEELERSAGATALAVALYDEETGSASAYNGERWFHAASTIKLAILAGVFSSIHRQLLHPNARLHVRNRFHSALDGRPFRVNGERDANAEVQAAIGKTMSVVELARHMIVTSSNLAANLLLDLVGLGEVHFALEQMHVTGIDVRRGVEDERAWAAGMNNRVTAQGLVQLLRVIAEKKAFSPELSQQMLDILCAQEFKRGIPARLPREVRVANKTGEISTIAHDAGIVFVPGRKPYILSVLTEWPAELGIGRSATIATISKEVFLLLTRDVPHA
ncbi:MAG: serine hydrolase [Candidatus Sumerlaeaceae bacterium]